jgi:hypothetical protein
MLDIALDENEFDYNWRRQHARNLALDAQAGKVTDETVEELAKAVLDLLAREDDYADKIESAAKAYDALLATEAERNAITWELAPDFLLAIESLLMLRMGGDYDATLPVGVHEKVVARVEENTQKTQEGA